MNVRQFLNAFGKLQDKGWKIEKKYGDIRLKPPIVIRPPDIGEGFCDCPITALRRQSVWEKSGSKVRAVKAAQLGSYIDAGKQLGLAEQVVMNIAEATDNELSHLNPEVEKGVMLIRIRMLRLASLPLDRCYSKVLPGQVRRLIAKK